MATTATATISHVHQGMPRSGDVTADSGMDTGVGVGVGMGAGAGVGVGAGTGAGVAPEVDAGAGADADADPDVGVGVDAGTGSGEGVGPREVYVNEPMGWVRGRYPVTSIQTNRT